MINFEAPTFEREAILARTRRLVGDGNARRACQTALARFEKLLEVRKMARVIRRLPEAEDKLAEMGVDIPEALKVAALHEGREKPLDELQEHLWSWGTARLEREAGPALSDAHRAMAKRLRTSAKELRSKAGAVLEPYGMGPGTDAMERELEAAARWHDEAAARGLRLEGQSYPRSVIGENFAEPL